jgi:hypothetical protein
MLGHAGAMAFGTGCGKGPQDGPGTWVGKRGDKRAIKDSKGRVLTFEASGVPNVEGTGEFTFRGPVRFLVPTAQMTIGKPHYRATTGQELGKQQYQPSINNMKIKMHGQPVTMTAAELLEQVNWTEDGPVLTGATSMT